MRILVTGHTGFKGAWLSLLLKEQGHEIHGLSLPPLKGHLFDTAKFSRIYSSEKYEDLRDKTKIEKYFRKVEPEAVFHLAAQPLVRQSYRDPFETFSVNVLGTLNILEVTELIESIRFRIIITTDKVYRNANQQKPFNESDPLGAADPYSTSKAMADLLSQSWGNCNSSKAIAIARAGNVIGGGDFGFERLIPDLVSAIIKGEKPLLRAPNAVRPWQHVLDCLNGYYSLLVNETNGANNGPWNFGPSSLEYKTVRELCRQFLREFKINEWDEKEDIDGKEAMYLTLDSRKANKELGWQNRLSFQESVDWTAKWYKEFLKGMSPFESTERQVCEYLSLKNV